MFIFIDESGIHKKVDHSTFVLVYIEIKNIDFVNNKIFQIENDLNINFFHWKNQSWKIKKRFLEEIIKLDFKIKVAVIKNPINPSNELENSLIHMIVEKDIKNIYIDGKKPSWYEKKLKKVLRDKGITVRKLRLVKDSQYPAIRLADALAGMIRWYFDGKNVERVKKYYNKLKKKDLLVIKK